MARFVCGFGTLLAASSFVWGCPATKSAVLDAAAVDPCANVACELGTHCEVRAAQCERAPCGKHGECAPDPDENPCNVVDCAAGQVCVVEGGKATCAAGSDESEDETADAGAKTAAAGKCTDAACPPKTVCDDLGGKVRCVPVPSCDGVHCDEGSHCELKDVQCIRAPCPPQPSCVKTP